VFEHFTCPTIVNEGWGPHSFSDPPDEEYYSQFDAEHDVPEQRNEDYD
jgi:hypothetical protein